MKILRKNIERDFSGYLTVIPESDDDIFCINNIITAGDYVMAISTRKVSHQNYEGKAIKFKTKVEISICVEKKDYNSEENTIRINGKNRTENEYVSIGQYHSHDISVNTKLTISKSRWESYYLNSIKDAADPVKCSDVCALLIQEGISNFFLINKFSTILHGNVSREFPKKKNGFIDKREKEIQKFITLTADLLLAHVNFSIIKCVIIGGPGILKDDLMKFILSDHSEKYLPLIKNKDKFLIIETSSAFRWSLNELFSNEKIIRKLENVKAIDEVKNLQIFYNLITKQPDKAYYGVDHVEKAALHGAVDILLITDQLIRSSDENDRRKYFKIMRIVQKNCGKVSVFCSRNQTGKELNQYGGIAAILRFPMPEIEDISLENIQKNIFLLNLD